MKQVKINIPEGYEIDTFNKETGEVSFKQTHSTITPEEEMFLEIFDGCTVRFDVKNYPYSIFYFDKEGNYLAEYNSKNNTFWIKYLTAWKVFETEFSLNYHSTKELLNKMVEEHFKIKGVTTSGVLPEEFVEVEEHLK